MTGYQALANAIVKQAAQDYMVAVKFLKKHPNSKSAMDTAMECERFFRSGWYATLTNVDPDYLVSRLRKEAVK